MQVKILSAQKKIFDDEATEVVLPGADGELSVLDFHQPFLYSLRAGQIKVRFKESEGRKERHFPVKRGLVKMGFTSLVALVEAV